MSWIWGAGAELKLLSVGEETGALSTKPPLAMEMLGLCWDVGTASDPIPRTKADPSQEVTLQSLLPAPRPARCPCCPTSSMVLSIVGEGEPCHALQRGSACAHEDRSGRCRLKGGLPHPGKTVCAGGTEDDGESRKKAADSAHVLSRPAALWAVWHAPGSLLGGKHGLLLHGLLLSGELWNRENGSVSTWCPSPAGGIRGMYGDVRLMARFVLRK